VLFSLVMTIYVLLIKNRRRYAPLEVEQVVPLWEALYFLDDFLVLHRVASASKAPALPF
jgi:hypothetical protein